MVNNVWWEPVPMKLIFIIFEKQINENKSSCYPETQIYKQAVCNPYNELYHIKINQYERNIYSFFSNSN